ncbi:MAG: sporulation protein [Betaproteobacteria bacterium CG2_30_59_46]|nr:MAG: sporulation protein [Betaproteobacteria bacterium CG2_30_59_46]PIQ10388.1 MAG: sporulation protein [Hydrogenophilales bacterium CG18_big_fil_WC_8_21_14_2_50_58_12]PIX99096.1 MAG: sporulation protein [Hydrogenophilales bacterium CG_4_10_14_3_um_filter_58_23]PJB04563.1 MAG: sporulation protein [Hydrogenophilales bacterium CG_4_9_14_3_um_filter_59_35]
MSRDYKKPDRPSSRKRGGSLFTGILIGLIVGLAVAIGVALTINFSPKPFVSRDKRPEEATQVPTKNDGDAPKTAPAEVAGINGKPADKPRFDFYTILPGSEEPVSEQEIKQATKQGNAAKENYFLQVGSFQAAAEADNMKARLALLGLEAVIQTTDIPDKGVWHRVRIGPFTNIEDMNRSRTLLTQSDIPSSLVKVKELLSH